MKDTTGWANRMNEEATLPRLLQGAEQSAARRATIRNLYNTAQLTNQAADLERYGPSRMATLIRHIIAEGEQ